MQIPAVCGRAGVSGEAEVARFEAILTKMLRSSVLEAAVRVLEGKAGGLFLYASLLARQLEASKAKVDFAELRGLPTGLSEVYQVNFERIVQSKDEWTTYSRLIALIIASREPLPVTLAREVRVMCMCVLVLVMCWVCYVLGVRVRVCVRGVWVCDVSCVVLCELWVLCGCWVLGVCCCVVLLCLPSLSFALSSLGCCVRESVLRLWLAARTWSGLSLCCFLSERADFK